MHKVWKITQGCFNLLSLLPFKHPPAAVVTLNPKGLAVRCTGQLYPYPGVISFALCYCYSDDGPEQQRSPLTANLANQSWPSTGHIPRPQEKKKKSHHSPSALTPLPQSYFLSLCSFSAYFPTTRRACHIRTPSRCNNTKWTMEDLSPGAAEGTPAKLHLW